MKNFFLGVLTTLIVIGIIGFIVMKSGIMPVDALSNPPKWEAKIAGMALDASIARRAKPVQNPIEPTDQNLMDGMEVYVMNCQECHGGDNDPSVTGSQSLYPRAPQFGRRRSAAAHNIKPSAPNPSKESNHDASAYYIVKNGIRYTAMPAWDKTLKDKEIWEVITFLSHMRNLPPAVRQKWKTESESGSQ